MLKQRHFIHLYNSHINKNIIYIFVCYKKIEYRKIPEEIFFFNVIYLENQILLY